MSEQNPSALQKIAKRADVIALTLGLIIAVIVFAIGVLLFQALGFGDNPVIGNATISTLSQ